jgi:hypothetical protein
MGVAFSSFFAICVCFELSLRIQNGSCAQRDKSNSTNKLVGSPTVLTVDFGHSTLRRLPSLGDAFGAAGGYLSGRARGWSRTDSAINAGAAVAAGRLVPTSAAGFAAEVANTGLEMVGAPQSARDVSRSFPFCVDTHARGVDRT